MTVPQDRFLILRLLIGNPEEGRGVNGSKKSISPTELKRGEKEGDQNMEGKLNKGTRGGGRGGTS